METIESDDQSVDIHGKPYSITIILGIVFTGVIVTVLNQNVISTALPHMMQDLNVHSAVGQWLTTGYMLAGGIMIPISAFAMTKIRTRILFLLSMSVFTLGTLLCAVGPGFFTVLLGRVIQAVGGGAMIPLMQTIVLTSFPIEKRGLAFGMMSVFMGVGPAFGPTIGGLVVDSLHWRVLFYFIFAFSAILIPIAFFKMRDIIPLTDPHLDSWAIIFSVIGFGSLLYGTSVVGTMGLFSPQVLIPAAVGLIFILLFIHRELQEADPTLDLGLLKQPLFALAVVMVTFMFMIPIGLKYILPIFIQMTLGGQALTAGLVTLPGTVLRSVLSPIAGNLYDKYGVKTLVRLGTLFVLGSAIPFMFFSEGTSILTITVLYTLCSIGTGLINTPVTTAGLNTLPNDRISHATAVRQTVRQVGTSIGTATVFTALASTPRNIVGAATDSTGGDIAGIRSAMTVIVVFAFVTFILGLFVRDPKSEEGKFENS